MAKPVSGRAPARRGMVSGARQPIGSTQGQKMGRGKPFATMGVPGAAIFGGLIRNIERSSKWVGQQKYITSSEIVTNISIVAASVHHFLNLISRPAWSVVPADDSSEARKIAEAVEKSMMTMRTPFSRIVRRAGLYRFHGFGVQEWVAKKNKKDGVVSFEDVEPRPQFTIERWEVADDGELMGVYQRSPQTGAMLPLPRSKIIYMVDDSLTDSPEGMGIFRHLAEPYERLIQYLDLEARGFERDLRGTPIGRAPLTLIKRAVSDSILTQVEADALIEGLEKFVKLQVKQSTTGMVLDSQPFESMAADGAKIAGSLQWGIELLKGDAAGLNELGKSIDRIQREMARIIGTEHLMMGDQGGNRALAADKSRNLYLIANSVLDNIVSTYERDYIMPQMILNGWDEDLRPTMKAEDVSFKDVAEITGALRDMATAGAVLSPDDPVIDDVRDLLGVSRQPERSDDEMEYIMTQAGMVEPEEVELPPGELGDDEFAEEVV